MPEDPSVRATALAKAAVPAPKAHGSAATRRMHGLVFQNEAGGDLSSRSRHGGTGPQPRALAASARNIEGLISVQRLDRNTPMQGADCFLFGPRASLRNSAGGLARTGVASDRVRHGFFGPADELLAA